MRSVAQQNTINQGLLEAHLCDIFPKLNIIKNPRKDVEVKNPLTGVYLEVDVWLPDIDLCFEFQDDYHFKPSWYSQIPLSAVAHKDNTKRSKLIEKTQTLIIVPYWWDGNSKGLQATIAFHRPDLLLSRRNLEIPANPASLTIGKQQLMLASFPETEVANLLDKGAWWIGEKWDGIRCFWDLTDQQLYTRHNFRIDLPPVVGSTFLTNLTLDGELWCGRGFYQEAQNFTLTIWENLQSSFVRLVCFDDASLQSQNQSFEVRYSHILSKFPTDHTTLVIAPRFLCDNETVMLDTLKCITEGGGEGVMMRLPQSPYVLGRSTSLFKIKASFNDQEALVVNAEDDGSLLLQLPNGFTFEVPKENSRLHQHAVRGDIVTFSFDSSRRGLLQNELTEFLSGAPTNPVVHRKRFDVSWQDVIESSSLPVRHLGYESLQFFDTNTRRFSEGEKQDLLFDQEELESSQLQHYYQQYPELAVELFPDIVFNPIKAKPDQQSWKSPADRRAFFDQFAASKGKDALSPAFWYSVTSQDLRNYVGYAAIAKYYGGRLSDTLVQLYPEIGLQKNRFNSKYSLESEMRAYFDAFAASRGEDSRNPNFWYSVEPQDLTKYQFGYRSIVKYFGGKLTSALMHLYPDIGLKASRLKGQSWKTESERRAFFDNYAISKGMDPLSPSVWYTVKAQDLLSYNSGYKSICSYYGGKLSATLMQLYPEIGLQKSKFKFQPWTEEERKSFFDSFAASKGGDPLSPSFWYSITPQELRSYYIGRQKATKFYGAKLSKALGHLYPDVDMQFTSPAHSWRKEDQRKEYFDKFALSKGADPLNPVFWYNVSLSELKKHQTGYQGITKYYGGKLYATLMKLYPNIGLQKSQFKFLPWDQPNDRKEFFDDFAASQGKDSLSPAFWYGVTTRELLKYNQAYTTIASKHGGKLSSTLTQLYPDIGLQKVNFKKEEIWADKSNRKMALLQFAKARSFDPLVPSNWYRLSRADFYDFKLTRSMLRSCYKSQYVPALLDLLPEVDLNPSKFVFVSLGYWRDKAAQRERFSNFAHKSGFDPLIASNWYPIFRSLQYTKDVQYIVKFYYAGNSKRALLDIFPDIGLETDKFPKSKWKRGGFRLNYKPRRLRGE